MVLKSFFRELKEMGDGIGNISGRSMYKNHLRSRTKSHIAPDEMPTEFEPVSQGKWANLPPELLLDIISRVEKSETSWPARAAVVYCASVCRSWREVTKEIVQTPEKCGKLTFPISLKQAGPRESPIQCFIKRNTATATYVLYYGLVPTESENEKLLLVAKRLRRATRTEFAISLVPDDFSRTSSTYVGKLRSNFLGTKFTIYDSQPASESMKIPSWKMSRRFTSKQVSPRLPACNYCVGTITYELNVLRTRGPRRMHCVMNSIPFSSIEVGGTVPTPASFPEMTEDQCNSVFHSKREDLGSSLSTELGHDSVEPLVLRNKAPRWHEQLQCWCLNFKGRVTVASVKNFQLVAAIEPSHNVPAAEQEIVILQFGKIGKDIFTMDYCYPLSAFQAFAICLSSFDTKPACE